MPASPPAPTSFKFVIDIFKIFSFQYSSYFRVSLYSLKTEPLEQSGCLRTSKHQLLYHMWTCKAIAQAGSESLKALLSTLEITGDNFLDVFIHSLSLDQGLPLIISNN